MTMYIYVFHHYIYYHIYTYIIFVIDSAINLIQKSEDSILKDFYLRINRKKLDKNMTSFCSIIILDKKLSAHCGTVRIAQHV